MTNPANTADAGHPPAQQASLFDDLPAQAPPVSPALVAIAVPAAAQTKGQRLFNKLIDQIRQQRNLLAQWQRFELQFNQRLATELRPAQAKLSAAQLDLLRLLDRLYTDRQAQPRLSAPQRRKLRACIPRLAETLLEDGPNADAEAIFDRYSDVSHAELQQIELAEAQAVFGQILGEDLVKGHQAETIDDLMRHAAEGMARAEAERAARAAERLQTRPAKAQTAKAQAAQQRKADAAEQAAKQAGQSVREAFRKLASALHPDRETDPAERERKTRLMQHANQAYERNDLLTLLSMQLDLEQIDGQHLANLPEARLAHYNQVLREQLAALQQELDECTAHYRADPGLNQRGLTPALVDAELARDIQGLRQSTREVELDIGRLRNPATRQQAIAAIDLSDFDDGEPDPFEVMLMMEALAGGTASRQAGKKRRRR